MVKTFVLLEVVVVAFVVQTGQFDKRYQLAFASLRVRLVCVVIVGMAIKIGLMGNYFCNEVLFIKSSN